MTENPAAWTVTDLARLAAAALAAGSPAQPNGRIREVPDVRTIRWYTSIGLLDRPAAMRGRTALYGRSHLAQLVAIKRLQASGLTVAAVQERLLGADAAAIEAIAMLPAGLEGLRGVHASRDSVHAAEPDGPTTEPEPRARFWTSRMAPRAADEPAAVAKESADADSAAAAAANTDNDTDETVNIDAAVIGETAPPLVHGLRLAADVTLLLPPGRPLDAAAQAAIAEAARPLLDLLDRLGLTAP